MSLTDDAKRMQKWACENYTDTMNKKVFKPIDKFVESYYEMRNNQGEKFIHEYEIEEFAEIKALLAKQWTEEEMSEIILISAVSIMKAKIDDVKLEKEEEMQEADENEIPEYVYVF